MSRNWEVDSEAVWKIKEQISVGLMKYGPEFLDSREFQELSRMLEETRGKEAQGGA
jgi:hypothetical protein